MSMSVGCFLGIRASYIAEAQKAASAYLDAINAALSTIGLPSSHWTLDNHF